MVCCKCPSTVPKVLLEVKIGAFVRRGVDPDRRPGREPARVLPPAAVSPLENCVSHPRRVLVYRDRELVVTEFADPPVVPQQLSEFGLLQLLTAGEMSNQRVDRGGQLELLVILHHSRRVEHR